MSKSMYAQGRRIESISDFAQCKSLWYKWNGRITHRSVLFSLQYRILLNSIIAGQIYIAERRTIEPERKKGRWIAHGLEDGFGIERYSCSECDYDIGVITTNYCPNCGADMRGER